MSLKRLTSLAILLFLLLAVSPALSPPENPLPLPKERILQAFDACGLPWALRETQSFSQGHEVHMVYNQNEKITAVLNNHAVHGMRQLSLQFLYSRADVTLTEAIREEEWYPALRLLCDLYGGEADAQEVYRAFRHYLEAQPYEPKERFLNWYYQSGGIYFTFRLIPSVKHYGSFDLLDLQLMNRSGQAEYQRVLRRAEQRRQAQEENRPADEPRRWKYPWEL